jgi:hypothetical protein
MCESCTKKFPSQVFAQNSPRSMIEQSQPMKLNVDGLHSAKSANFQPKMNVDGLHSAKSANFQQIMGMTSHQHPIIDFANAPIHQPLIQNNSMSASARTHSERNFEYPHQIQRMPVNAPGLMSQRSC